MAKKQTSEIVQLTSIVERGFKAVADDISRMRGEFADLKTEMLDQFEHVDTQFRAANDRLRDISSEIAVAKDRTIIRRATPRLGTPHTLQIRRPISAPQSPSPTFQIRRLPAPSITPHRPANSTPRAIRPYPPAYVRLNVVLRNPFPPAIPRSTVHQ